MATAVGGAICCLIAVLAVLRIYLKRQFVARPSEKAMGKDAGVKSPQSYPCGTPWTFCSEDTAHRLCSRPQQNMPFERDSKSRRSLALLTGSFFRFKDKELSKT